MAVDCIAILFQLLQYLALLWTIMTHMVLPQQLLNRTGLLHLLKEVKSTKLVVDFPNIGKATNFNAADNHNYNEPCHHDHRLKNICPNNSLQTTLQKENVGTQGMQK